MQVLMLHNQIDGNHLHCAAESGFRTNSWGICLFHDSGRRNACALDLVKRMNRSDANCPQADVSIRSADIPSNAKEMTVLYYGREQSIAEDAVTELHECCTSVF